MRAKSKEVKIYAPPHFKATWEKFIEICERDGQSASGLVRVWVEGYVERKDPGNPQRPITAWSPGHEDEQALRLQGTYRRLADYAREHRGEIQHAEVLEALPSNQTPKQRLATAYKLERRLLGDGFKVWR